MCSHYTSSSIYTSRTEDNNKSECKTQSGNILVNYKFCAMTIVNIVFVASKLRSNNNSHSLDNFAELVEKFQLALHRHYNTGGHSLYQSDELKSFCQTHCPHLYDILLSSITRVDGRSTQKNHTELQQQRVVVLLHTLAYFRYSILILIVQHEQV